MLVHARTIAHARPPSSRVRIPVKTMVSALARQEKSATRTMSSRTKSVRFATKTHSAVRDRRSRNRDGVRRQCNKAHRESSHSGESSGGGRLERQVRDQRQCWSLVDDLSSLPSCGRSNAYRISEEGFSSREVFKSEKNFLPRVRIRGIARTCAEAGLSKRSNYNASDHF